MKHFKHFLSLCLLLCISITASAHDFEVDGIYYNFTSDKTVAVSFQGTAYNSYSNEYSGSVTIPSTVSYNSTTYSVTSIAENAFLACTGLTSVVIPNSVTSIGIQAFSSCSSLKSVNFPSSITEICDWSFKNCSLTSITIPESVTRIGTEAFYGCSKLASITITESVIKIGYNAFFGTAWYNNQPSYSLVYAGKIAYKYKGTMPSNTSITLKNDTKGIGDYAFSQCSGLTSITIPNSVISIGEYSFFNCSGLSSVSIPNTITSVGQYAFYGTAWFNSKSDGLVYVGQVAYSYKGTMPNNTAINIKEGTKEISGWAFCNCSGLTSITIPNSVTNIGHYAFQNCSGLGSITIPNSVTSIKEYTFQGCSALTSITIPNSVTSIEKDAFYGCSALASITIPNSVTSIGEMAFKSCSSLASIIMSNSLAIIEKYVFDGCSALTSITIPNSVASIRDYAFYGCYGLKSAIIGNAVKSIGDNAFSYCYDLKNIEVKSAIPPICIGTNVFYNVSKTSCEVRVPKNSVDAYKAATGWMDFTKYVAGNASTQIYLGNGSSTFESETLTNILNINLPNNALAFIDDNEISQTLPANFIKKNSSGEWVADKIALTDAKAFYCPEDVKAGQINYSRTFTSDSWQALYIPFEVTNDASLQAIGKIAYINNVHQYDAVIDGNNETVIEYKSVPAGGKLLANRMYVIKPKTSILNTVVKFSADNAVLRTTASNSVTCASTTTKYTFTGNYQTKTDMFTSGAYALKATGFGKALSDSQTLPPFRFFLTVSNIDEAYDAASSSAPQLIRIMVDGVIEDEATSTGLTPAISPKEGATYNLSGQKVGEDYKGIVIKNGRKVFNIK